MWHRLKRRDTCSKVGRYDAQGPGWRRDRDGDKRRPLELHKRPRRRVESRTRPQLNGQEHRQGDGKVYCYSPGNVDPGRNTRWSEAVNLGTLRGRIMLPRRGRGYLLRTRTQQRGNIPPGETHTKCEGRRRQKL